MIVPPPISLVPRQRRYGWSPDIPDQNDRYLLRAPLKARPKKSANRATGFLGTPFDQGQLGSCTGNGCSKLMRFDLAKQGKPIVEPSRLFIYYGERQIENAIAEDAGANIRDGLKVLNHLGAPDETLWPYVESQFAVKPSPAAYADALTRRAVVYNRVPNRLESILDTLARGFPIVCGFSVYESFESDAAAKTGVVPNPKKGEKSLGGHCVVLVDYAVTSKTAATLTWLNSWGTGWGDGGFFHTKSSFLTACGASDFWTCETTS